jgi:hypothetical protein
MTVNLGGDDDVQRIGKQADLSITKTVDGTRGQWCAGRDLTYTITVNNPGILSRTSS